jgi:hypothetical protein
MSRSARVGWSDHREGRTQQVGEPTLRGSAPRPRRIVTFPPRVLARIGLLGQVANHRSTPTVQTLHQLRHDSSSASQSGPST